MIISPPSVAFEAIAQGFDTGLVGTIGVRVLDGQGATTTARSTSGIVETPASSGVYTATITAPASAGQYVVHWDDDASSNASEQLLVTSDYLSPTSPADAVSLCTVEQVKRDPTLSAVGTTHDTLIAEVIGQASRDFLGESGREFVFTKAGSNPQAREIKVGGYYRDREIPIGDLSSTPTAVSLLAEDGSTLATLTVSTDVEVLPRVRESWEPITALRLRYSAGGLSPSHRLSVTGTWGWPAVPEDVQLAVRDTVVFRMRQHRAVTQLSPDQFEEPEGPQRAFPLSAWAVIRRYRTPQVGGA